MVVNRIISGIAEKDGKPVVPGAYVVRAQADNHFTALGPLVLTPKGRYKGYHPILARLWRESAGRYAVEADSTVIDALDAGKTAKTFEAFALSADAAEWSCKDGIDGSPCISSATRIGDTRPVRRVVAEADLLGEDVTVIR